MSIKYGQVEKTMDKAMFIILLICGLLILVISVTAYALYKKDIARYMDYSSFNGSGISSSGLFLKYSISSSPSGHSP